MWKCGTCPQKMNYKLYRYNKGVKYYILGCFSLLVKTCMLWIVIYLPWQVLLMRQFLLLLSWHEKVYSLQKWYILYLSLKSNSVWKVTIFGRDARCVFKYLHFPFSSQCQFSIVLQENVEKLRSFVQREIYKELDDFGSLCLITCSTQPFSSLITFWKK